MAGGGRFSQAARAARRATPVALELYRRWDRLSPAEKQRYIRIVREQARRGSQLARAGAERGRRLVGGDPPSRKRR